jgi:RNA polymerase sigma-70 factor (ECF subfamily)
LDLEQIYDEHYRSLVGFITKRTGDRARAEELAQDVFVRAIRSRPRNARGWLYAVAANLVRDDARRAEVARRHLRVVAKARPVPPEMPERILSRKDDGARLQAALGRLSARDRQALLMKENGMSYDEIAARLDLSRGSVGTTLARARRRLVAAWESGAEVNDNVAR